jgi:hypothetical protein
MDSSPAWCDAEGRALFRLVVGEDKVELPGRWLVVNRRFVSAE